MCWGWGCRGILSRVMPSISRASPSWSHHEELNFPNQMSPPEATVSSL